MTEEFKNELAEVINKYILSGMDLGCIYYVTKDMFLELTNVYNDYLNERKQQPPIQIEEEKDENKEEEE